MDDRLVEALRMFVIAGVIALVINIFYIFIFEDGNFSNLLAFSREEIIQNENNRVESIRESVRRDEQARREKTSLAGNRPKVNTSVASNSIVNIEFNKPMNFNGMPKDIILAYRKNALKMSPIFSEMQYSPSVEVFRIEDHLPWISINGALHFNSIAVNERVVGPSRESIGILNPELLYYISVMENEDGISNDFKPLYKDFDFTPHKIEYNSQTNTITVYTKGPKYEGGGYQPLFLSDSNAHDLGYRYAYMDSSENVGFYTDEPYRNNTLKSKIQSPEGFYMCGSACGVEGGCNNYAPYWQYYNFLFLRRLPARFNIKLWHNRPQTTQAPADINFEMVFE